MPLAVLPAGILIDVMGGQQVIRILAIALLAVTTLVMVTQSYLRSID